MTHWNLFPRVSAEGEGQTLVPGLQPGPRDPQELTGGGEVVRVHSHTQTQTHRRTDADRREGEVPH